MATARKSVPRSRGRALQKGDVDDAKPLVRSSYMVETNGGGNLERVAGFNAVKARSEGFSGGRVPPALRDERLGVAGDIEFARPQFTFGSDDRVLIGDTSALPWRCVCQLVVEGLHGREVLGTGWMAGPRTVLTAGHNLLSHVAGHQAARVWIMPARSGDAVPFGYRSSTSFIVHPLWQAKADREHDIGAVWLDDPLGDRLGWFGITAFGDEQLSGLLVNNSGYPADKPLGTQWFNAGRVLGVKPRVITYGLDTEPGQSGSPIFLFTADQQRIVVAVHAYGDSGQNMGVRITPALFQTLVGWIR
jgi:glutamyl endopeptidase